MVTQTLQSLSIIRNSGDSSNDYYCTEDQWREYTGFTNQYDFPSADVIRHLENATEQVKKDAFYMVREEFVTKDSEGRYFTQKPYWGNRYGRDAQSTFQTIHGEVTKYDIELWEGDSVSSISSSFSLQRGRQHRLMYRIPYEAITEIDPKNGFFKLSSSYPTESSRQIYVTYWAVGKPLEELKYELKRACFEMVTILALKKLKTKRLKKGTTQYTLGKKTIIRDEDTFDKLIDQHKQEYHKWIRWIKPFIGRRAKIGRIETENYNRYLRRY